MYLALGFQIICQKPSVVFTYKVLQNVKKMSRKKSQLHRNLLFLSSCESNIEFILCCMETMRQSRCMSPSSGKINWVSGLLPLTLKPRTARQVSMYLCGQIMLYWYNIIMIICTWELLYLLFKHLMFNTIYYLCTRELILSFI